jgi:hypothetical protein
MASTSVAGGTFAHSVTGVCEYFIMYAIEKSKTIF